jgi:PD-(D/E)XK nuclease superfamily
MELTSVQIRTLDELIGRGEAPECPPDLASEMRTRLEERLREVGLDGTPWTDRRPLWIGKSALNDHERCPGLFEARLGREGSPFAYSDRSAAGSLFHKAIEIDVAAERAGDVRSTCDRAATVLADRDTAFGVYWRSLDAMDRAQVLADAAKALVLFRESFPPLVRRWQPQTEMRLHARVAEGRVTLSGAPDLVLGSSRRLVVDLKSRGAWPEHPEDVRFYALLLALRTGRPPYRVATFFLQSGEWQAEDVTEETLDHAADRVVEAVRTAARLDRGEPPHLRSGAHCSWCPRGMTCPASILAGPRQEVSA